MKRRYLAEIARPRYTLSGLACYTSVRRTFKSLPAAERWAARVLAKHPTHATRYKTDAGWEARFADLKRNPYGGVSVGDMMFAPEVLRPTVGELGYW